MKPFDHANEDFPDTLILLMLLRLLGLFDSTADERGRGAEMIMMSAP